MFINQKEWLLFQQDSENNSQEPEVNDSEEVTPEKETEEVEEKKEPKKESPKPKPKKTTPKRKPVTKKKTTVIEEETSEEEDEEEEPIKSSTVVPTHNLELENRILKSAIETSFDAEALTAFVMRDLKTDENGTEQ